MHLALDARAFARAWRSRWGNTCAKLRWRSLPLGLPAVGKSLRSLSDLLRARLVRAHLSERGVSSASAKVFLAGLQYAATDWEGSPAPWPPMVVRVLQGMGRAERLPPRGRAYDCYCVTMGEGVRQATPRARKGVALPLSLLQLDRWSILLAEESVPLLDWTVFQRRLLRAQITLGFYGCLRVSEYVGPRPATRCCAVWMSRSPPPACA